MKYAVRSFIGTRKIQEDSADCFAVENGLLAVVCDGIGSRSNGGESSQMAVQGFVSRFQQEYTDDFPAFITKAAEAIDNEVFEKYGQDCGTTAVVAYIDGDKLYWLSIGDSRIYIIRDGCLKQITTDHNYGYVLRLRKEKQLIDEETYQKQLNRSGQLASFIGMGGVDIVEVSMKPITLKKGDKLLLTTDGLYKPLAEQVICDIINGGEDPQKTADKLLSAVKSCDQALDNTTFTIIFYDESEEIQ